MVELTDSIAAYRTYPHIDRAETGQYAAQALNAILKRGQPTGRAFRKAPFLIPLNGQCTMVEPSKGVTARSKMVDGDLINLSYLAGFPPSDLYWCGPSVIAHAWSQEAADQAADEMMAEILAQEKNFAEKMVSPEDGVEQAMRLASNASRAIVIADTQDNPGCGGSADSTGVLKALVAAQAQEVVLGFMCDAQAAAAAHAAGAGSKVTLKLGGRSGPVGVTPFEATFSVDKLGNGKMKTDGAVSGGREIDVGPMALLRVDGIRIVVTSKRFQALDQAPFRHLGIEPAEQKILVLKSTCHYRAEFEPLAEHIIVVLAPGYYLADPTDYPFKKLREGVRLKPLGEVFSAQHATNG